MENKPSQNILEEKKKYRILTGLVGFSIVADSIFLDQLSKWLMIDIQHVNFGLSWASFTYAENKGIAFSLPLEGVLQQVITVLLILGLLGVIIRYATWHQRWLHYSLMFILGGAIGNAIDRLARGYVIDFIQIGTFPIFNIADSCVTIGVVGVLIYELIIKPRREQAQAKLPV